MSIVIKGVTYFDTNETIKELDITRQALYDLVQQGKLTQYKRGVKKNVYYSKEQIDTLNTLNPVERTEENGPPS